MRIMVSACLLGENCKYSGGNNLSKKVLSFVKGHEVVPVCPEILGGLPVPRIPCEICDGVVMDRCGQSRDKEFHEGAQKALEIAKANNVELVILQPRSPSCGVKQIYSGNFDGTLIEGSGVFAKLLMDNNFKVLDASEL